MSVGVVNFKEFTKKNIVQERYNKSLIDPKMLIYAMSSQKKIQNELSLYYCHNPSLSALILMLQYMRSSWGQAAQGLANFLFYIFQVTST